VSPAGVKTKDGAAAGRHADHWIGTCRKVEGTLD
jgi:hypothetical protein